MTRRPIATVRVIYLSGVSTRVLRVEIECSASTTGITYMPSSVEFDVPSLTRFAVVDHEERCSGGCDTGEARRYAGGAGINHPWCPLSVDHRPCYPRAAHR
jgi:hypothetical protein